MKQAVFGKFMVIIALQQFQAAFLTKNRAASAQPNVPTPLPTTFMALVLVGFSFSYPSYDIFPLRCRHASMHIFSFFLKCVELYFSTPDIKVQAHIRNNNARSTFSQHSITPDFPSSFRCVPYHLHTFPKSRFQEFPKYFHNKHLLQDKLFCYS